MERIKKTIAVLVTVVCMLTILTGSAEAAECFWDMNHERELTVQGYEEVIDCMRHLDGNQDEEVSFVQIRDENMAVINQIQFNPINNFAVTHFNGLDAVEYNYQEGMEPVMNWWLLERVNVAGGIVGQVRRQYESLIALFAEGARSDSVRDRVLEAVEAGWIYEGEVFNPALFMVLYNNYADTCAITGHGVEDCPVLEDDDYRHFAYTLDEGAWDRARILEIVGE